MNHVHANPVASPCVMVIFGATGDLTKRKLIPALCNLAGDNLLSKQFAIIGFAGNDFTTESFRKTLAEEIPKYSSTKINPGGNRFFYLAVAPRFFSPIVKQLGQAGLTKEENGQWARVIVEKPFGHDLQSARQLNEELKQVLNENQIYRIDHYLGKETVQNVLVFRFSNNI